MATPLVIEIALHYWTRPGDYREGDLSAPAVSEAIRNFVDAGLLVRREHPSNGQARYYGSDGLRVYVEALRAVPFPVLTWQIPKGDERGNQ